MALHFLWQDRSARCFFEPVPVWRGRGMLGVVLAAVVMAGALVAPEAAWAAPAGESPAPEADTGSVLQAPDIVSAQTIARLQDERVEVIGERTETSSTWANPDGTLTTGQAQGPVWVRTGDGDGTEAADWVPVDLALVAGADGSIRPKAHVGDLTLAGSGVPEDGRLLSVDGPSGGQVSLQWSGPLPEPRLDGPRAIYAEVQPNVDLVVEATPSGYEQYFVLTDRPADGVAPDLSLTVATEGMTASTTEDGGVALTDADGVVVGTSGTPQVWDAEVDGERDHPITEDRSDTGTQPQLAAPPDWDSAAREPAQPSVTDFAAGPQISTTPQTPPFPAPPAAATDADAGQADDPAAAQAGASDALPLTESASQVAPDAVELDLAPSAEFLADPDTQYPVVVDPAVNFQFGFDTYVQTNVVNTDLSNDGELRLGTYDGGATVARSFLNFDLTATRYTTIQYAELSLWNFYSASCQARNWEVWATDPAGPGTRANAQPTWWGKWATSGQTAGYSSSCGQNLVRADVTSLIQAWANGGYGLVGMGLKAENESDNLAWKKFVSANGTAGLMPTLFVQYNTPPAPATNLTVSGAVSQPDGAWTNNKDNALLGAIAHDADGPSSLLFQLYTADGATLVHEDWAQGVANGQVGQVLVPAGKMAEGGRYKFVVHTYDGIAWNTANSGWSGTWTVDTTKPLAPVVDSAMFPNNGTWNGEKGQMGAIDLHLAQPDPTALSFKYSLDTNVLDQSTPANASTPIAITPAENGIHALYVQAVDKAGNTSDTVKYVFNVGRAGLVSPLDGSQVVRRVRLETSGDPALTYVRYQWRRGPDATVINDVPLSTLTAASNTPLASSWTKITNLGGYATWDAGLTLGHVAGPVQVRPLMATDASGAGTYEGPWVTVTVSPDARNAATTDVGPGSANLLTGDYTLSSTDVDEFGLSVVRTASSRDPRSGLQPQAELLTSAQQTIADTTGFGLGNAVTVSRVTNRFHSQPVPPNGTVGQDSLNVRSAGGSADAFTHVLFNGPVLKAGRTYRISGWIYAPAATGLSPQDDRGLRLVAYSRLNGTYTETRSSRPAVADAWQQVSLDLAIPAGADDALVRLYNGFSAAGKDVYFDDLSVREIWAPLGPQWELGTADEAANTAYTQVSQPAADVAVVNVTGGGEIWFTGSGDKWWPEPGAEGMVLSRGRVSVSDATPLWTLRELDGTVSTFRGTSGPASVDSPLESTAPPVTAGQTRLTYASVDGRLRLDRLIAPVEPGVDPQGGCLAPTPPVGCEVLQLVYATTTTATASALGSIAGQLDKVVLYATPEGGTATSTTAVDAVRYAYDNSGRLREVWDPRISPALKTSYSYDTDGRVTTVTPPGELAWTFRYGTGGANATVGGTDLIDRSSGRLLSVSRPSLVPGTVDQTGPDTTSTLVYAVPTTRAAGGPYDLDATSIASWAQTNGPTDATAVFGPEDVPTVTTATATNPGKDGYKPATVHYLDSSGREVDTASPAGPNAPAAGYIDSADYDRFGNVTRSLDATNRLLALGQLPTATADLAALGLSTLTTADRALALSTLSSYSSDGIDLLRTRGPRLRLAIGNDPGDVRLVHDLTTYAYDEGKPDGLTYHLVTTQTEALLLAGSAPEQLVDIGTTVNGYNPIDGAPAAGPSSGWKIGSPTVVTVDAGTGGANLTARVRYNELGKVVESRKIGSTGTDAGTTITVYYTAAANPADPACGNSAAYAGLACITRTAGAVTGGDSSRMATSLPVRRVTAYNRYGSIAAVTETATGPVTGAGTVTQERTTTTVYDSADRVTSVTIAGTGAGTQAVALGRTINTYDPASGDVTRIASVNPADNTTVVSAVAKTFDRLGRMTRYDDGAGGVTTSTFDRYGKPTQVSDSLGTTTSFTYDRSLEPRGFVTSVTDSVAGTLAATYGPDGQVLTQSLPGGVSLGIGYDANQQPTSRTYRRISDNAVISSSSIVENGSGQWVTHTTAASAKRYVYDRQGRLTDVQDTATGAGMCTSRRYAYNDRAERTSMWTVRSGTATCADPGNPGTLPVATVNYTYDSGDRLVSDTGTGAGDWVYDPFGRITTAPVRGSPGKVVRNAYYANDLIQSQTIDGVARQTWTLDALQRFSSYTNEAWAVGGNGQPGWQQAVTKVNHYDSDGDSPAWIAEDASLPNEVTRYIDGLDGNMAMQTGKAGARVLQLIDLHGDVMTILPILDGQTTASWAGLQHQAADEFGNPTDLTSGTARASTGQSRGAEGRYSWIGGKQRSADALAGVVLMGVRLYDPGLGRFWSVDPIPGGSATAYDYANQDPVNRYDLTGLCPWCIPPAIGACRLLCAPIGRAILRGAGNLFGRSAVLMKPSRSLIAMSARTITYRGQTLPGVPRGSVGTSVYNGNGLKYGIPSGTRGLDPRVTHIRIMGPVRTGPHPMPAGYAVYMNRLGQTVNPRTGRTISRSDPWSHIPLK